MQAVLSILTQQKTARRDTRQAVVFIALCGVLRTNDRAGRLRVLHLCGTFGRQKCPKSPGKRDGKSRRLPVCGAQSRRLAVAHAPLTAAPFPARFFCPRQRSQAKPRPPLRNVRRKRGSAGGQSPGPLYAMSAGNAAALAGKSPDPSTGNKKPLPPGEVAAVRLTERVVGADFISARARLPLSRELSAQSTEGEETTFRRRNFLLLFFAGHSTLKRDFFREKEHSYESGTV